MEPQGPKLAEGRDSEIYEHGPGRVLRVARDGRSLVGEAEVMRYARSHGYPVPDVHDAGDGYLVMDRLEGPTMLDAAVRRPHAIGGYGRLLADLHKRLHAIPAPPSSAGSSTEVEKGRMRQMAAWAQRQRPSSPPGP